MRQRHHRRGAVQSHIGLRGDHRDAVDIAGDNRRAQDFRRRDRQHAGAGADIEDAPCVPALCQHVQCQQAAARGAVMSGAESQRRFDLDADLVRADFIAVMRAVDDEASGVHRHQAAEALRDPVGGFDRLDGQRAGGFCVRSGFQQRAQRHFVRRVAEMDRQLPAPVVAFESGAGGILGIETFAEERREPAGGGLIAEQAGNGGGGTHRRDDNGWRVCRQSLSGRYQQRKPLAKCRRRTARTNGAPRSLNLDDAYGQACR